MSDFIREAAREAVAPRPADPPDWPEAPRPPGTEQPTALPGDAFPEVARDTITSVADSLQVHPDLPALFALLTTAAAIADRVDVWVRSEQREPLALYGAGIAAPGERKSPVFSRMTRTLYRWQRDKAQSEDPRRRAALDLVDAKRAHLAALKKKAGKDVDAANELEDARIKLDRAERDVPSSSSLILDDVTPEKLAVEMQEQGGRGAIFSAEGDVLRIFAGRYGNGDPRADLLKKALNGEGTKVSRIGRETVWLPRPILTVGLMFQPSLLGSLDNRESLEGEGVFARFLVVQPQSALGSRLTGRDVPEPDRAAEDRFGNALARLLEVPPAEVRKGGGRVPHVVGLTRAAGDILFQWEADIEEMLAPGGYLRAISGWGGKVFGFTCRIAALMELLDRADRGEDLPGGPIGAEAATGAVLIARSLATHAKRVFGELGADQRTSNLVYLWKRILELAAEPPEPDGLTLATLRRAVQGRKSIAGADDVKDLVEELVDRGCVRLRPQGPTGGRPRADRLEVNPRCPGYSAESAVRVPEASPEALSALSATHSDPLKSESSPPVDLWQGGPEEDRQYLEDERKGTPMEEPGPVPVLDLRLGGDHA